MTAQVNPIERFNGYFRQPTLHPLVAVGELSRARDDLFTERESGMYCVVLLDSEFVEVRKNGKRLAHKGGSIFSVKPGQSFSIVPDYTSQPRGWILAFRQELLEKAGLGRDFYMFEFFEYDTDSTLTLSARERGTLINCYENVLSELQEERDYLTNHMIRLAIGRLLSYCKRYYERQYSDMGGGRNLASAIDTMLENYLTSSSAAQQGQPTVSWCAAQFNLSPNYFGSLVRREMHISAHEYIQGKIIDAAKRLLSTTSMSVGEIAEELGFSYANHFTRLFKSKTGLSPQQYRKSMAV